MKIKTKYGCLKESIKQVFKDFIYTVNSFTFKDDGILKLKNLLTKIGIESEIIEKRTFNIIISENPNIFEKELIEILDYRICSSCNKFTFAPIRSIDGEYIHNYSTYSESFLHQYKPFCEKCFQPILEQWKNQLKGIRDRWVKKEHPEWKKTETGYIDEKGNKYPL